MVLAVWDTITTSSFLMLSFGAFLLTHLACHFHRCLPPMLKYEKKETIESYHDRYRNVYGYPERMHGDSARVLTWNKDDIYFLGKRPIYLNHTAFGTFALLVTYFSLMYAWVVLVDRIRVGVFPSNPAASALLQQPGLNLGDNEVHEYNIRIAWHLAISILEAVVVVISSAIIFKYHCLWLGWILMSIMFIGGIIVSIYGLAVQTEPWEDLYEGFAIAYLVINVLGWIYLTVVLFKWWKTGKGSTFAKHHKYYWF